MTSIGNEQPPSAVRMLAHEWPAAIRLVALMTLGIGLLLIAGGVLRAAYLYRESSRGIETLATIDAAAVNRLGTGGAIDLSWLDDQGATRHATGVEVTSGLGRKLRIGNTLSRAQLRIRYKPDNVVGTVLVIEDVPEQIKRAAAVSIAGFFAMTAGSALMLWLSLRRKMHSGTIGGSGEMP